MKFTGKIAIALSLCFAGCADPPAANNNQQNQAGGGNTSANEGEEGGIKVDFPGGSFSMDGKNGISVKAPGVDVRVILGLGKRPRVMCFMAERWIGV